MAARFHFVGIGSLRTLREFVRQYQEDLGPSRPWDIALWSGVSPQGSANTLRRLCEIGLVREVPPRGEGQARRYIPVTGHPLWKGLTHLFQWERNSLREIATLHAGGPSNQRTPEPRRPP